MMTDFEPRKVSEGPEEPLSTTVRNWLYVAGGLFGFVLVLVGVYFAVRLFGAAYLASTAPEPFGPVVDKWTEFLGGEAPLVDVKDQVQVSPRLGAVFALAFSGLIMLWVTTSVIKVGARIIYWMGTDLDAVKRVLSHVFGPSVIKVVKGPSEERPRSLDSTG